MWKLASVVSSFVLVGIAMVWPQDAAKPAAETGQDRAVAATQGEELKIPDEAVKMVNPVKATAVGLAHAKKVFGYNCSMCHGKDGDGQGDLAEQMKLKLKDWRDPASLKDVTDGELFYIISKGKGQMPAGAQQMKPDEIWTMVLYVRSFAQKATPAKAKQ
jgi:mono/diheme cytochrome c family protein